MINDSRSLPFDDDLTVYVNGRFVALRDATISVIDRGFLYGDGVYETMMATNGRVFRISNHLDRLFASAHAIRLQIGITRTDLEDVVLETLSRNGLSEAYVRIVVSRGVGFPNIDPRTPTAGSTVMVISHARDQPKEVAGSYSPEGLNLCSIAIRKTPPQCLPPQVKSLNYLNQVLARMAATDAGADEAVMLDTDGFVAEGSGDNIFAVRGTDLITPGAETILLGVTRGAVMELAPSVGLSPSEKRLTTYDLYTADEVFLSSTYGGIIPVRAIDGRQIGTVCPGPMTTAIRTHYLELLNA